jgi:hypothetical protein
VIAHAAALWPLTVIAAIVRLAVTNRPRRERSLAAFDLAGAVAKVRGIAYGEQQR